MLTRLIKVHMADGYSRHFILLLEDYGRWCRYFGCKGHFKLGHKIESYFIDDESALIIDRAFQKLKDSRPMAFKVLDMYLVGGLDSLDIAVCLNTGKSHKDKINHLAIIQVIDVSQKLIFDFLEKENYA